MNFGKFGKIYRFFLREIFIITLIFVTISSLTYFLLDYFVKDQTYRRRTDTRVAIVGDNRNLDKDFLMTSLVSIMTKPLV
ncbi:MAG: hypothetical protein Q4D88_05380 [Anaerococcus sp.]|nr:hypothetical protein [Anaerococcus sp.]